MTLAVVAALATSELSGTGAANVGEQGPESGPAAAAAEPGATSGGEAQAVRPASTSEAPATTAAPARRDPPRRCEPTTSNPGGDNNYIPDAPAAASLGRGFVITGLVRAADGCRPLPGVRVQVWLATETGDETDNRASVRTDADGRYRIETAPTVPQFGEPNIHVAYDDEAFRPVFIRRVVDLDDTRAVVDLTLARP